LRSVLASRSLRVLAGTRGHAWFLICGGQRRLGCSLPRDGEQVTIRIRLL
jgi:hypothetical protein